MLEGKRKFKAAREKCGAFLDTLGCWCHDCLDPLFSFGRNIFLCAFKIKVLSSRYVWWGVVIAFLLFLIIPRWDRIYIGEITVPDELSNRNFSSHTLENMIGRELVRFTNNDGIKISSPENITLQRSPDGIMLHTETIVLSDGRSSIPIPKVGLTIDATVELIRNMFGCNSRKISGEITGNIKTGFYMTLSVPHPIKSCKQAKEPLSSGPWQVNEENLSSVLSRMISDMGAKLLRIYDPYTAAKYDFTQMERCSDKLECTYAESVLSLCDEILHNPFWRDFVPQAHILRGYVYSAQKKYAAAIDEFKLSGTKVDSYLGLAGAFFREGNYLAAKDSYSKVLSIDPKNWTALLGLGNTYAFLFDYDRAMSLYMKAIQILPNDPAVRNNLGYLFARQGRCVEARKQYNEAVNLSPKLRLLYSSSGQLQTLKECVQGVPKMPQTQGKSECEIASEREQEGKRLFCAFHPRVHSPDYNKLIFGKTSFFPKSEKLRDITKSDKVLLKRVEVYFNKIRSFSSDFKQIDDSGNIEVGYIEAQKPGKMRVIYTAPSNDLIIVNGRSLFMRNEELKTSDTLPMDQNPLEHILGDALSLSGNGFVTKVSDANDKIYLLFDVSEDYGSGVLVLMFMKKPLKFIGWIVLDGANHMTIVSLDNVKENPPISGDHFIFP